MIFGAIIEFIVGGLLIVLGFLVWIKKMISVLHSYHYKNVKEEDIPAYCRLAGIAQIVMGAGIVGAGVLNLLYSALWWIPLVAGFSVGFTIFVIAQKKYNGSIFG